MRSGVILAAVTVCLMVFAAWLVATRPELILPVGYLASIALAMFVLLPMAYRNHKQTQGIAAVLLTVFLGPIAVLLLLPWVYRLERRGT